MIVYVFSPDTGFSSHFLSWFTWLHDHLEPDEEYILPVRDVDLGRAMFDFAKATPTISLAEIRRRLTGDTS